MTQTTALHILNKAPDHPRVARCLAQMSENDKLVLMENGVYCLTSDRFAFPARSGTCFALEADMRARGLQAARPRVPVELIDYHRLVALTVAYPRVIHW